MKKTLFALLLLSATGAFGQVGAAVRSSVPVVVQFESHPLHAKQNRLAAEENILFSASSTSAQGERPLWEFAKPAYETPLGDIARMLREQHSTVKKAVKVLEK